MDIIINNGAEAEVATRPTEVIVFEGRDGTDGETPNLLDYIKRNELGDLAFDDLIELAMLGTTIIVGGYIKTQLIDVNAIRIQGNLATTDEATALANIAAALALTDFSGTLGDLAFENLIEASKLGTTIIEGGYIKSVLLDVNAIRVQGGLALASDTAEAIQAAASAMSAATAAQQAAEQANIIIGNIASDNVLSAVEKPAILKEWQAIQSEVPKIQAQATKYGISYTAYTTAFNTLSIYIDPLVSSLETDSAIDGAFFRLQFKNYYDAKVSLLKAISDEAKDLSDAAMAEALAAAQAATGAQNTVDALMGDLGELAFENAITLAKLDDTIIQGGYIKTTLIDVQAIRVSGSLATTSEVLAAIAAQNLGDLAYDDLVNLAKLDSTIIVGGYIKTSLLDVNAIRVSGSLATTTNVSDAVTAAIAGQNLGDLAYDDLVGLSKLDSTVIIGGYIKTSLIDVDVLQAQIVTADYITTLGLVASNIKTNNTTGKRLEIVDSENNLIIYRADGKSTISLDDDVVQQAPYTSSTTAPTVDGDGNYQKDYYSTYMDGETQMYVYATLGPGVAVGSVINSVEGYSMLSKDGLSIFTNANSGLSIKKSSTEYQDDTLITGYGITAHSIGVKTLSTRELRVWSAGGGIGGEGILVQGLTRDILYKGHDNSNKTANFVLGVLVGGN